MILDLEASRTSQMHCVACSNAVIFERTLIPASSELGYFETTLVRCGICGLTFVHPKPTLDESLDAYSEAYYAPPEREKLPLKYRFARNRYRWAQNKSLSSAISTLCSIAVEVATGRQFTYSLSWPLLMPKESTILDVGCGSGGWLLTLKSLGYSLLYGSDITANKKTLEHLAHQGITIRQGMISQIEYPDSFFDVIRMEHVLEHLPDPEADLNHIYKLLKPGGYLVLGFPSIDSFWFRISPKDYAHLSLPYHIFFHTLSSGKRLIERTGFQVIAARSYGVPGVARESLRNMTSFNVPRFLFILLSPMYSAAAKMIGSREYISILARRPS